MQEELEGSVRKCVQDIEHSKTLEDSEWNEVVKKHIDNKLFTVQEQMNKVQNTLLETREMTAEQRDKESRRNNIVLYKVPESDAGRAEDRNEDDISVCLQSFNNGLHVGLEDVDLVHVHVFHLGHRGDASTCRPLLVQLASYTFKNIMVESLYKLRHVDRKFRAVTISHDMTKLKREENRRLVEESRKMIRGNTCTGFEVPWGR